LYYVFVVYVFKNREKKWIRKHLVKKEKTFWERSENEIKTELLKGYLIIMSFTVCSIYVGYGFAKGYNISQDIKNNKLEYNYSLSFEHSDKTVKVHLIGSNSENYFYVVEGSNNVRISPVTTIKY